MRSLKPGDYVTARREELAETFRKVLLATPDRLSFSGERLAPDALRRDTTAAMQQEIVDLLENSAFCTATETSAEAVEIILREEQKLVQVESAVEAFEHAETALNEARSKFLVAWETCSGESNGFQRRWAAFSGFLGRLCGEG
jgi:hypothetical protein